MSSNIYSLGQLVALRAEFRDGELGGVMDPDAVEVRIQPPSGSPLVYVFGTDEALVNTDVGQYSIDISADQSGRWYYEFVSTGVGQAGDQKHFEVRPSRIGSSD